MTTALLNLSCEIDLGPGEKLTLPDMIANGVGPGRWLITIQPAGNGTIAEARDTMDATEYLLSNPESARRLRESIAQLDFSLAASQRRAFSYRSPLARR